MDDESWGEQDQAGNKINLNTASKDELAKVQGIGNNRADEIVRYRDENGSFDSVDDLEQLPGFAGRLSDDVKQRLTV